MRAVKVGNPASIENLRLVDASEPGQPGPGEIKVKVLANSLNFKDYLVATGRLPAEDGRILLSDAGGEVVGVGEDVTDLIVGDWVVATYHTRWPTGRVMPPDSSKGMPGDAIDGYARDFVVTPSAWFTRAPEGYSHGEAATLTCAGVTAWRVLAADGPVIAGQPMPKSAFAGQCWLAFLAVSGITGGQSLFCVCRIQCGLCLTEHASAALIRLTQFEPETTHYCSSSRASLRAAPFNRSIADEARQKFPRSIETRTAHSRFANGFRE